ncbi:MAG: hypothetical protein FWC43_04020 [Planctomycetaceae bacterium]|nr:hypothetical protein [Planctomycetaceae bacterium]
MSTTNVPLNELLTTENMDFSYHGTPLTPILPEHYVNKAYVDKTVNDTVLGGLLPVLPVGLPDKIATSTTTGVQRSDKEFTEEINTKWIFRIKSGFMSSGGSPIFTFNGITAWAGEDTLFWKEGQTNALYVPAGGLYTDREYHVGYESSTNRWVLDIVLLRGDDPEAVVVESNILSSNGSTELVSRLTHQQVPTVKAVAELVLEHAPIAVKVNCNGVATTYGVTHGLNTTKIASVQIYDVTGNTKNPIGLAWEPTTANTITLKPDVLLPATMKLLVIVTA